MKNLKTLFVDSHVHLDLIFKMHPEHIARLQEVRCLPVSWAFGFGLESVSDLKKYLLEQRETIHSICDGGLDCYYLTGVHPRNITADLKPEDLKELLSPQLDDPLCLGLGETGLEEASSREKEILIAQLEMAEEVSQRDKVIGVHTPRKDKVRITEELLEILQNFLSWRDNILVDHCVPDTIGGVLNLGFWAGVTISPIKTSFDEVGIIAEKHSGSLKRILLNTDSGTDYHDDLIRFSHDKSAPEGIRTMLARENALEFFRIKRIV